MAYSLVQGVLHASQSLPGSSLAILSERLMAMFYIMLSYNILKHFNKALPWRQSLRFLTQNTSTPILWYREIPITREGVKYPPPKPME